MQKRNTDFRNTDTCIYSEGVLICKSEEEFPERLSSEEFMTVDVIMCAAPDLRKLKPSEYNACENFELHVKRAKHIMHESALCGVDILITGAFRNDPEVVAMAWNEALKDYRHFFDYVVFAVYFRKHEIDNFYAFNKVIE